MIPDRALTFGLLPAINSLFEINHALTTQNKLKLVEEVLRFGSFEEAERQRSGALPASERWLLDSAINPLFNEFGIILPTDLKARPVATDPDLDVFFQEMLSSRNAEKNMEKHFNKDKTGELRGNIERVCGNVSAHKTPYNAVAMIIANRENPYEIVFGTDDLRARRSRWKYPFDARPLGTFAMAYCNTNEALEIAEGRVIQYEVCPRDVMSGRFRAESDELLELAGYGDNLIFEIPVYDVLVKVCFSLVSSDFQRTLIESSGYSRLTNAGFADIRKIIRSPDSSLRYGVKDVVTVYYDHIDTIVTNTEFLGTFPSTINEKIRESIA